MVSLHNGSLKSEDWHAGSKEFEHRTKVYITYQHPFSRKAVSDLEGTNKRFAQL